MKLKNPGKLEFEALIEDPGGGGAFVRFPFDIFNTFGTKGMVKVKATFDHEPYRGSLVNMGTGCHVLIVKKEIRERINKNIGDKVKVIIELDTEPRIVDIPNDLQKILDNNKLAKEKLDKLSYSHKKEYVDWINEAKKEETRLKRIKETLEMLNK